MKYSVIENHEKQLDAIWSNKEFKNIEVISRGYHTVESILNHSILFIGINPSFNLERSSKNLKTFVSIKQESNEYQKYYKPFETIAKELDSPWSHLDVLYFRETSQKYIDTLLKTCEGREFINYQLVITKEILENCLPKCIVVCNAKAREFLGKNTTKQKWMNYNFKFDDHLGTYRIDNAESNLNSTPVFFSSMLSGARALDIGSKERLVWQIKRVLEARKFL